MGHLCELPGHDAGAQPSATGGIGGILYTAVQAFPLNGATLAGSQVSISLLNGLILQGALSPYERSMSG